MICMCQQIVVCIWNWILYVMIEVQLILTRSLLSAFFWNVWLWSVSQPRRLQSLWSPLSEPQISCVIYRYYSCMILIYYVSKKEDMWFIRVGVHATLAFFDSVVWDPGLGLWRQCKMLLCSVLCVYLLCASVHNAHICSFINCFLVPFLLLNCVGKHGRIAVGERKLCI
jgi:hypothetical protein